MRRSRKRTRLLPSFWCRHCARDFRCQRDWGKHLDGSGRPRCTTKLFRSCASHTCSQSSTASDHDCHRLVKSEAHKISTAGMPMSSQGDALSRRGQNDGEGDRAIPRRSSTSTGKDRPSAPTVCHPCPSELLAPQPDTDTSAHRTREGGVAYMSAEDSDPDDNDNGDDEPLSPDLSGTVAPQTESQVRWNTITDRACRSL